MALCGELALDLSEDKLRNKRLNWKFILIQEATFALPVDEVNAVFFIRSDVFYCMTLFSFVATRPSDPVRYCSKPWEIYI
jgi:hypothetical protein